MQTTTQTPSFSCMNSIRRLSSRAIIALSPRQEVKNIKKASKDTEKCIDDFLKFDEHKKENIWTTARLMSGVPIALARASAPFLLAAGGLYMGYRYGPILYNSLSDNMKKVVIPSIIGGGMAMAAFGLMCVENYKLEKEKEKLEKQAGVSIPYQFPESSMHTMHNQDEPNNLPSLFLLSIFDFVYVRNKNLRQQINLLRPLCQVKEDIKDLQKTTSEFQSKKAIDNLSAEEQERLDEYEMPDMSSGDMSKVVYNHCKELKSESETTTSKRDLFCFRKELHDIAVNQRLQSRRLSSYKPKYEKWGYGHNSYHR